ncbi:MAG: flagellar biosynthesis repressor FlbT [Hyphomicrobiales bacterium]|nr:flagellar biosynthesis repressor FlbT [Hyphomicrobiales bacterium]OQW81593.1 MAG: flagellar biosynthesis repressor FlbT [Proteobacteria bacterium ST_bin15]
MSLKVELKPGEKIIIGESVLTNGVGRTTILIDGTAPILRERDALAPDLANTPASRIYLCVQMMYLHNDILKFHEQYLEFVRDLITAAPSFTPILQRVSNFVLRGMLYKAVKEAKSLLSHEKALLSNV